MLICIRTDANYRIGSGHVMRCLTLADLLREKGAEIFFICRELRENLNNFIETKGYKVYRLLCNSEEMRTKEDAEQTIEVLRNSHVDIDTIIIDSYSLDNIWQSKIRSYVRSIMVIDDLANQAQNCDILLNQNFYFDGEDRYRGLLPENCQLFLGPQYGLIKKEFFKARSNLKERSGIIKRVLVSFGGADLGNVTKKALEAIKQLNHPDISVDVVIGAINTRKKNIEKLCSFLPRVNVYYNVNNIAELISGADLAIGAGGITIWERCYLGLPSIVITVALNQLEIVDNLAKKGALWNIGFYKNVSTSDISLFLKKALDNPTIVRNMSKIASSLMIDTARGQELLINTIMCLGAVA